MTDKPKRTRNVNAPLTATDALGRIRAILADQEERIADLRAADCEKIAALVDRVRDPQEHDALYAMATALKVELPVPSNADPVAASIASAPVVEPDVEELAALAEAEPAGIKPYVPGPAARAARAGR